MARFIQLSKSLVRTEVRFIGNSLQSLSLRDNYVHILLFVASITETPMSQIDGWIDGRTQQDLRNGQCVESGNI